MDAGLANSIVVWRRELDDRLRINDDFHLDEFYLESVPDSRYGSQVEILSSFTEHHNGTARKENPGKGEIQLASLDLQYGWRLWLNMGCLAFGLFLSSLETTIIATSLVSISSDLGSFDKSNWVVTSYLLTYTGFLIIFARISDLFGRKGTVLVSLTIFTLFSLACGVSRTMEQLIIFRAFQGMGGAGLYSMAVSIITEITPLKYIGISSGLMGSIFAMSSLLGPNLGGAITYHSTWRWVFYLNLPPGCIGILMVLKFFPRNARPLKITQKTFGSMDFLGMISYLTGSIMIVFALEEGGSFYPWGSAVIVASFVLSGVGFIGFFSWEWFISKKTWVKGSILPLFPMHLGKQRVISFSFLTALLAGFPFLITIVFLPQRFQLINGLSPVDAGLRMLPLLLVSATGAALGGIFSKKHNVSWYVLAISLGLQVVGLGLMTTLPTDSRELPKAQYGYQVLLGLGFGLSLSCLVIVAQMQVKNDDDVGITISAITQIRVLGGVIGVAAAQAILNRQLSVDLDGVLPPDKLEALQRSATAISSFTPAETAITIECYGRGFNLQYKIMMGLSAAALLASLGCFQRRAESFDEVVKRRIRGQGVELD